MVKGKWQNIYTFILCYCLVLLFFSFDIENFLENGIAVNLKLFYNKFGKFYRCWRIRTKVCMPPSATLCSRPTDWLRHDVVCCTGPRADRLPMHDRGSGTEGTTNWHHLTFSSFFHLEIFLNALSFFIRNLLKRPALKVLVVRGLKLQ